MKKIILTFLTSVFILCGLKILAFGDDVSSVTSSSSQQLQIVEISSEKNINDDFLNHGHHAHLVAQTEAYTETINYYLVGTNKKIAPSIVKKITFKREGYRQIPSREIVWLEWNHDSESFESIVSPTIKGYTTNTFCTPQIKIVPGQGSQRNYEYNVYYMPESNGEINSSSGSIQSSSLSKMSSSSLIKNSDNRLTVKKNVQQKEKRISSYSEKNQSSSETSSREFQINKAKNKRIQSIQNSSEKQKSNIKQSAKNNSNNSSSVNSKSKNNIKIQNRSVNTNSINSKSQQLGSSIASSNKKQKSNIKQSTKNNSNNSNFVNSKSKNNIKIQNRFVNINSINSKSQQSGSSIASNDKHVMKKNLKNLCQKNNKIENKFNLIEDIEKKPILMISGLVATIAIVFELFDQRKSK